MMPIYLYELQLYDVHVRTNVKNNNVETYLLAINRLKNYFMPINNIFVCLCHSFVVYVHDIFLSMKRFQ